MLINNLATEENRAYSDPAPGGWPGRNGGDEALADSSAYDERSDEKVIVNEQRANKTVNAPSQTAANTSEAAGNDEEIIDETEDTDE